MGSLIVWHLLVLVLVPDGRLAVMDRGAMSKAECVAEAARLNATPGVMLAGGVLFGQAGCALKDATFA
jgi:hypothetical protein